MYIHLGQSTVIRTEDVIGIFDIETSSVSKRTRDYLSKAEKNGEVINVAEDLPKSFIVCKNKNKKEKKVYLSQISSATLCRRSEYIRSKQNG